MLYGDVASVVLGHLPCCVVMARELACSAGTHLNGQALASRCSTRVLGAGRAMELGRECLDIWGYKRVDELIWVKVNQLQRLIRTGRTGHWLNHSKEHCLVGIKGNPNINRNVDCDVLVGEASPPSPLKAGQRVDGTRRASCLQSKGRNDQLAHSGLFSAVGGNIRRCGRRPGSRTRCTRCWSG